MKKTIFLLMVVALMLLVSGCSSSKKDEILGTYQIADANHDSCFIVFEKTEEEKKYRVMAISVEEDSDKANVFYQRIVTLDTKEKNLRIIDETGAVVGEYFAKNKLLNFIDNNTYKKMSDKKLSTEEMKKLVTEFYQGSTEELMQELQEYFSR